MGQLEVDAECKVCKGTGIYVGFAERDKAGIKCHDCNGTGKRHLIFDWTEFKERNIHPDIDWVYENNPGVVVGTPYAEYGGMPYSEFLKGNPFPRKSEGRSYNCPAWWYQSIDYSKKPCWKECTFGTFYNCPSFGNKEKCWEKWDKEHPDG